MRGNLLYGAEQHNVALAPLIEQADLYAVLNRLPAGLQTELGKGADSFPAARDNACAGNAPPATLLAQTDSRCRALLDGERAVRATLWHGTTWRHVRVEHGHVEKMPT